MLRGAITPLILLAAFILILLVSLSIPIIHSIDLFKLTALISDGIGPVSLKVDGSVSFGVWGYCITAVDASAVGIHVDTAPFCSKPHLGYTFDQNVLNALHVETISNSLTRALTIVLVLHPLACGFTFLALFLSTVAFLRPTTASARGCSALTLIASGLAAGLTTLAFLVDVIGVAEVRHKVHEDSHGTVTGSFGSATWMTLAAAILLWLACFGACCGIFEVRRRKY